MKNLNTKVKLKYQKKQVVNYIAVEKNIYIVRVLQCTTQHKQFYHRKVVNIKII